MKKAMVIGCHTNGLGVIRSLALENFHIIAMHCDPTEFAHASKHVHEKVRIPHPRAEEKRFIEFLIANSDKWKDALVIETNDEALIAVSKNKAFADMSTEDVMPFLKRISVLPMKHYMFSRSGINSSSLI